MSEVSSEAVEAAALRMCRSPRWDASWDEGARDYWRDLARDALTAALPYLVAHQPARVVPSAEEVARALFASRWPTLDWGRHSAHRRSAERDARAILALFASQPTVAEVREQAAREIEAAGRDDDRWHKTCDDYRAAGWDGAPDDYERMFWESAYNQAARIARGETSRDS